MTRTIWRTGLLGVALLAAGCGGEGETESDATVSMEPAEADVADARAAAGELGARLLSALTTSIADQGVTASIDVCRLVAPATSQDVSVTRGLEVGRTSLRVRNPLNAPDAWERAQLEAFTEQAAAGADPSSLEHAEVVMVDGEPMLRWMKAIPLGPLCAQCHGTDVAPEVAAAIANVYPNDQATGFAVGDIRGAFTVTKPLDG